MYNGLYTEQIEEGMWIVRDYKGNQIGDYFQTEEQAFDFIQDYLRDQHQAEEILSELGFIERREY